MVVRLLDAGLFRRWGGMGGQHEYRGHPMFFTRKVAVCLCSGGRKKVRNGFVIFRWESS